jgi:hypothetical protein
MRTRLPFVLLVTALTCLFASAPAHARARTFVASYGNDANPCTFGSPCKTFQQAVNVVDPGGEVTAIDSAGFGPISIGKSVTITSPPGVEAGIVPNPPSADAIDIINASSTDTIVLRGLTLQGGGSGDIGIFAISGANIEIVDCAIRGFVNGINIATANAMTIAIYNTVVADSGTGVFLKTSGGTLRAALDGVRVNNNGTGISVDSNGHTLETMITNSHLDNGGTYGFYSIGTPTFAFTFLKNVTLSQTPTGISLNGSSFVFLSQVVLGSIANEFTNVGISFSGSGNTAESDGTNHIGGTFTGGASLSTWTLN